MSTKMKKFARENFASAKAQCFAMFEAGHSDKEVSEFTGIGIRVVQSNHTYYRKDNGQSSWEGILRTIGKNTDRILTACTENGIEDVKVVEATLTGIKLSHGEKEITFAENVLTVAKGKEVLYQGDYNETKLVVSLIK